MYHVHVHLPEQVKLGMYAYLVTLAYTKNIQFSKTLLHMLQLKYDPN